MKTKLPLFCIFIFLISQNVLAQVPVVKFSASKYKIGQYESVQLFDSSTNSPFEWRWNVYDSNTYKYQGFYPSLNSGDLYSDPMNNGNNEFTKNPEFAFDVPGLYTVTLQCRNNSGWSTVLVKKNYIKVTLPTEYYLGYGTYGPNNDNIVDSDEGSIYDDGGPKLNYSNDQGYNTRSFLTIKPCNAKKITLTMSQLKFAGTNDVLRVFDGTKEDYSKLLAAWTKNNTGNKTVTANSGTMYILFTSDGSGQDSGYIGTYTSVLDTATNSIGPDFACDSIIINAVPALFTNQSSGTSGVPVIHWSVDGDEVPNNSKSDFKYTFYTNGTYKICMDISNCSGNYKRCKNITVVDPVFPFDLNFKASNRFASSIDPIVLKPVSTVPNCFKWTISPTSYTLLNPPYSPSTYGPGYINYNGTPGDSFPTPKILFLDTVCYTITLTAFNSLIYPDTTKKITLVKTDYVCGKPFKSIYPLFGNTFEDKDNSCDKNGNEIFVSGIPIKLYDTSNNLLATTNSLSNGLFGFEAKPGKYLIKADIQGLPVQTTCPTGIDTVVVLDSSGSFNGVHFAFKCNSDKPDLKISSLNPRGKIFPGQFFTMYMDAGYLNKWVSLNCNPNRAVTLRLSYSGKISYQGTPMGAVTPSSVSGNTITYQIADVRFMNKSSYVTRFKTDTSAVGTDSVFMYAEILPTTNDADTVNNRRKIGFKVGNSFDPNMKEVYPYNVKPLSEDWLTYTIHFQNTGTAPAYNIVLRDTLDSKLRPETFQILDASHAMRLDLRGRNIKFYFDDIMLPDSFSDVKGSQGYVQYRIKPVSGIPDGIKINNTAYIFFDYNKPVVTNTAETVFENKKGNSVPEVSVAGIKVYPNPSGDGVFLVQVPLETSAGFEVYNAIGLCIANGELGSKIDLSNAPAGVYFLRVESMGKVWVCKLVKEF